MPTGYYNKTGLPVALGKHTNRGKHWSFVKKTKKHCLICNKVFRVWPSQKQRKFCSVGCKNIGMSEILLGRKPTGGMYGRCHSEETKRKMSQVHSGDRNSNWRGGKCQRGRHEGGIYKRWTKRVFEYDNYNCWVCGEKGGQLQSHHLKSWAKYPKLRFKIFNGITLCKECHKLYGYHKYKKNN